MKKLVVVVLLLMAASVYAANSYTPPVRSTLTESTVFPVYNNSSGARGVTGARIKTMMNDHTHGTYTPDALGTPTANGQVLTSTTAGVRQWSNSSGVVNGSGLRMLDIDPVTGTITITGVLVIK